MDPSELYKLQQAATRPANTNPGIDASQIPAVVQQAHAAGIDVTRPELADVLAAIAAKKGLNAGNVGQVVSALKAELEAAAYEKSEMAKLQAAGAGANDPGELLRIGFQARSMRKQ